VKNSDPTKYVTVSHRDPAELAYPGTYPTANSSDPTANRTAIHQPRARGAHHVDPAAGGSTWWERDPERTTTPSGRTRQRTSLGCRC